MLHIHLYHIAYSLIIRRDQETILQDLDSLTTFELYGLVNYLIRLGG